MCLGTFPVDKEPQKAYFSSKKFFYYRQIWPTLWLFRAKWDHLSIQPSTSEMSVVRLCCNWYLSEESRVGPESLGHTGGNRQLGGRSKLSCGSVPDSNHPVPGDPEHSHSFCVCKRPCRGAINSLSSEAVGRLLVGLEAFAHHRFNPFS